MTRTLRILTVFVFMVVFGSLSASAQQPATTSPPAQQGAAATQGPATKPGPQTPMVIERYVVGQARPPVTEGSELVELTLEQAFAMALEKNLELKVARMAPVITDYTKQNLIAAYRPNFSGSYSYRNALQASNNNLDGVDSVTNVNQSYNASISQNIRYFGAPNLSVGFQNGRGTTNNVTARLNPSINTGLSFSASANLTNQFKMDQNRNNWRKFPIQREIADITLLNNIESTRRDVRNAYWALRSAIEQIEIARRALEIAQKNFSDSLIRVEIGTAASIDTVTFELSVASSEQNLIAAQNSWQTAELNFKRLLVSGTDDPMYRKTINPTDKPDVGNLQTIEHQAAVTRTLAQGTNLLVSRKNLDMRRMDMELTKANLMPSITVNGGYNVNGQAGISLQNGQIIGDSGWFDALGQLGRFPTWNIGFNVSYPLGQLQQKAAWATAQIQHDQAVAQLKAQELTTATAVINAGMNVDNSYRSYQAAIKSREAAEKNADAAQVRFDNGLLTNVEVVSQQNALTNARLSELNSLIRYINAVAEYERIQKIGG
jgi:outer membrane protein TolC